MYTRASNRSESTDSKTTQPNGPPHFDPNRTALTPSRRAWRWIPAIFPSHPPRTTTLNGLSAAIFFSTSRRFGGRRKDGDGPNRDADEDGRGGDNPVRRRI